MQSQPIGPSRIAQLFVVLPEMLGTQDLTDCISMQSICDNHLAAAVQQQQQAALTHSWERASSEMLLW